MRRRALLGGVAATGLSAPRRAAGQRRAVPVVGLLVSENPQPIGESLRAALREFLREILPAMRRVGVRASAPDPFAMPSVDQFRSAAPRLDVELLPMLVQSGGLDAAFASLVEWRTDVAVVQPIPPLAEALATARRHRLAVASLWNSVARAGAVVTYGAQISERMTKVAADVDRSLKGAKPADLPVAQPTRFELLFNLVTARSRGITVPQAILSRADEVIV